MRIGPKVACDALTFVSIIPLEASRTPQKIIRRQRRGGRIEKGLIR